MIALGQDLDDYFFLNLKWQINDGTISQNIQLESADFNSNEYGYYPQWWKVAQNGIGIGSPFSFIGGGYGSNYGFLSYPGSYLGSLSGYGGYNPFSSYYPGLYNWSSPFFGFSGGNYGGYFSGYGNYNPFARSYPGSYYGNFGSFFPYV